MPESAMAAYFTQKDSILKELRGKARKGRITTVASARQAAERLLGRKRPKDYAYDTMAQRKGLLANHDSQPLALHQPLTKFPLEPSAPFQTLHATRIESTTGNIYCRGNVMPGK
jgi:hypothetical protein